MKFKNEAKVNIDRVKDANGGISFKGKYHIEQWRKGKKIDEWDIKNGVTNEGLDNILDIMFNGSAQDSMWFIGLIDNTGFSAVAAADTMASHAGWTEIPVANYGGIRGEWLSGAAASQTITNGTTIDLTVTGSENVRGVLLTKDSTGTLGTLWATALFSSSVSLSASDTLKVTYTITAS